ncbi:unnamed protein product [Aphanomyces euteiches]
MFTHKLISAFAIMSPQVYFITGANKVDEFELSRGLGYEAARIVAEKFRDQAVVLLGTRSLKNGEAAIAKLKDANPSFGYANVHLVEIDVSNKQSIQAAADFVKAKYGHVHVLINNAGMLGQLEGSEMCLQVNVYGVYETLLAFHPLLVPHQSTHIVVASTLGAWTLDALSPELQAIFEDFNALDIDSLRALLDDWLASSQGKTSKYIWPTLEETSGAYGISKMAVLALTRKSAIDYPEVKTVMVCPGYCATDISGHTGYLTAAQGGEHILYPILHPESTERGDSTARANFSRSKTLVLPNLLESKARIVSLGMHN